LVSSKLGFHRLQGHYPILVSAINARQKDLKISVVYPDQIDYEKSGTFKFSGLRKPKDFEGGEAPDVTLTEVYGYLENEQIDLSRLKERIKIVGLDPSSDELCTPQEPLYSYLVFETEWQGKRYILSNKKWYCVDKDYLARVEKDLQEHVQLLGTPTLKVWPRTANEEIYNALYQNEPDYLCLDKQMFIGAGYGRSKIEVADIFHEPTKKLLFVKKLNRSATLSHLFSQATISADLFKESSEYRDKFLTRLRQKWPHKIFDEDYLKSLCFVYTVGTSRQEPLVDIFPVFSKINLLKHLKILRKLSYGIELAKVSLL